MKPKLVLKDSFQSSGENATSRGLGLRRDSQWPEEGGGRGPRASLKITPPLHPLFRKKKKTRLLEASSGETKVRKGRLGAKKG